MSDDRPLAHVCQHCQFWGYRPDKDPVFGLCRLITANEDQIKPAYILSDDPSGGGILRTTHFFGCNQWENK